jgi:hypothetical protein
MSLVQRVWRRAALSLAVLGALAVASAGSVDVGLVRTAHAAETKAKAKAPAKKTVAKKAPAKKTVAKKAPAKKKKKSSPPKLANMPKGWSWPPNKGMVAEGTRCLKELDGLGIAYKKAKRIGKIVTPITLASMNLGGVKLTPTYQRGPFTIDCHLALGLATHLPKVAAYGITELTFSRIYGYTKVRTGGGVRNALSRHALGLAIDIRGFTKADGTKITVLEDYPLGDEDLLSIEQELNDSGGFRSVLTPANDPESHDDHFHIEVKVEYSTARARKPTS